MPEVVVHEDEVKTCTRRDSIVHAGVTSCLTVTAVLDDELVGLHVVQIGADDTMYPARLPGLLNTFTQRVAGRPIRKLLIVAPMDFYPAGIETTVRQGILNAPVPDVVDITQFSEKGNDVYVIGYANTVQSVVNGKVVLRQPF